VLDNHDDFGDTPSATNFLPATARCWVMGTFSIESPAPYSAGAKAMVEELGIDVSFLPQYVSKDLYRSQGLAPAIFFFFIGTFGTDQMV